MTGSAIRKPRIQPGRGSARADSTIEGRTKVTGSSPRTSKQRVLTERLREGVGVRPSERPGTASPEGHHAVADPVGAQLLGLFRQQGRAGRSELGACRTVERR